MPRNSKKSKLSIEFDKIKKENTPEKKYCDAIMTKIDTVGVDWSHYKSIADFMTSTMSIGPAGIQHIGYQVAQIWDVPVLVSGNLIYQMLRLMEAADGNYSVISNRDKSKLKEMRDQIDKIIGNLE